MILDLSKYNSLFDGSTSSLNKYKEDCFKQLGSQFEFPSYRYSSFVNLTLPSFSLDDLKKINMVDASIEITKSDEIEVLEDLPDNFQDSVPSFFKNSNNLDVFHDAFLNSVRVIKIPENYNSKSPIVVNLTSKSDALISSIFIIAGKNSSSKVIIKNNSNSEYFSSRVKVYAEENASINYVQIDNVSENSVFFGKTTSYADKVSNMRISSLSLGGKYIKSDFISNLIGEGASSKINALYLSNSRQKQNIHAESRHLAKNTYSDIFTKGAINGKSKSLCTGNIFIGENAFSSNGYETQNALLLSDTAEADAIPNLEIHNNDVKCSHGSTIGQIDSDIVFYLMSRGLTKKAALSLFVQGFFRPVIDSLEDSNLENELTNAIQKSVVFDEN